MIETLCLVAQRGQRQDAFPGKETAKTVRTRLQQCVPGNPETAAQPNVEYQNSLMYRLSPLFLGLLLLASLSGCVSNGVVRLQKAEVAPPSATRAVVIFGIGVEAAWEYPQFGIVIDEYDIKRQAITGNCWRYNRMNASVPNDSRVVNFFAFEINPGYFSLSGFNTAQLLSDPVAFLAPAGQIVYLGDFIYSGKHTIILRRGEGQLRNLRQEYMNLADKITLAGATSVAAPRMFLCAP